MDHLICPGLVSRKRIKQKACYRIQKEIKLTFLSIHWRTLFREADSQKEEAPKWGIARREKLKSSLYATLRSLFTG